MDSLILNRVLKEANYIIKYEDTVRDIAKIFNVSKSTVHKDIAFRLLYINNNLAMEVRKVLDENKAERHIRGGLATKRKYSHLKEQDDNER